MTDMETAMIRALAAIDDALGMPQDGCNNTAATLKAIALLHSVVRDDAAEINRLEQQRDELLAALKYAVECGMVPVSSAADGGASRYSTHVIVADQIRAAIAKAEASK